ncbi:hypothetical protein KPL37_18150, partial [Clostridium frigoris]
PTVASKSLALRLSSRWLGDIGFFQPIGSANMLDVQKTAEIYIYVVYLSFTFTIYIHHFST